VVEQFEHARERARSRLRLRLWRGTRNTHRRVDRALDPIMRRTTATCLFMSKDGRMAVQLLDHPLPEQHEMLAAPSGMVHACRLLGIPPVRTFRRTTEGSCPIYEEV